MGKVRGVLLLSLFVIINLLQSSLAQRLKLSEIPEKLRYLYNGELDDWEPEAEFYKNFPYYLSGYDDDGRPVWVIELGRWDIRNALNKGEDHKAKFDRYVDKGIYRILKSIGEKEFDDIDEPVRQVILIFDMEGYGIEQLQSLPAVGYILRTIRLVLEAAKYLNVAYAVNTNFVAETLINIARPALGKAFSLVDVYGTNPSRWRPILRKKIPEDQIPEWYGGSKDFKPVRVYG